LSGSTAEEAIAQEGEPRRYGKGRRKRERRSLKFPTLVDSIGWVEVEEKRWAFSRAESYAKFRFYLAI
jgi:1,2-phenylacetyl-CoA epoxidase PaaB subunit